MDAAAMAALEQVKTLYCELNSRRGDIRVAHDYYRGKQPLRYATDKWAEYHAMRYERFSDNWTQVVANSPKERLRVDGFRLDDDPTTSPGESQLWHWWQANDMDVQSSQGFLESLIAARSFVLVWGTLDDEPLATWERADQVIIGYDPENHRQRLAALKCWTDDNIEYATLYTSEYVWKWQRKYSPGMSYQGPIEVPPGAARAAGFFNTTTPSGLYVPTDQEGWEPRQPAADNTWPIPNPLGVVPVVEFANRPMLGAEPLSEIAGTIAMQDAINLLWAYAFNAADFASMPARVVMGQEPPKLPILDSTGAVVGEQPVDLKKLSEDRIMWLTGAQTKIGQWDAAKLDVFTAVIESAVAHIAAQTRTPPHYLILGKGMVNISADGIKAAETGLVMKVKEEQLFFGPSIRETFRLMALVAGDDALAEQAEQGVVQWRDPENHSEAQLVDALLKLNAIGFPFEFIAERYGLSQTELERVMAMKERAAALDPIVAMADAVTARPPRAQQAPPAPPGY